MQRLQFSTASPNKASAQSNDMYNLPLNIINQYLKASSKLKKIERMFFKHFGPNVVEVRNEFYRLVWKFTVSGITQYAAMCHIGQAKCYAVSGETDQEADEYLRAARVFLKAYNADCGMHLSYTNTALCEAALHSYHNAVELISDGTVTKACIIREIKKLQENIELTSFMDSSSHRLYDIEMTAEINLRNEDYLLALHQYDDIVDNIYERNVRSLYAELLRRVEVLRVLLLVNLNLAPACHSPAHSKLIEYYYNVASFNELLQGHNYEKPNNWDTENEENATNDDNKKQNYSSISSDISMKNHPAHISSSCPGEFVPIQQQYAVAEIVHSWSESRISDLNYLLKDFAIEFTSISRVERDLLKRMRDNLEFNYRELV